MVDFRFNVCIFAITTFWEGGPGVGAGWGVCGLPVDVLGALRIPTEPYLGLLQQRLAGTFSSGVLLKSRNLGRRLEGTEEQWPPT